MLKILTEPKTEFAQGALVTLGNFDGVHRGHQALLKRSQQLAQAAHLPFTIVLFEPQPQEFFQADKAPARLTNWLEKILALQAVFNDDKIQGYILTLHFEAELAALTANDFIHQVLLQQLHIKHLVVGADFHFGSQRSGDVLTLQEEAKFHDYQIEIFPDLMWHGQRVSSTGIRAALAKGDFALAADLLTHPYTMIGDVIHGMGRGHALGYPTANLALSSSRPALHGVFAVRVHGVNAQALSGMANIGSRPTVDGGPILLEVHIFDFDQDIYGCQITVEFVHYIRAECKFASTQALQTQLGKDIVVAKQLLHIA